MKSSYLMKQAGISPGTAAILSAGAGAGLGYLLDSLKVRKGEEVENRWIRPLIYGGLAATPSLIYGAARSSYDKGPDGSPSLSLFNRWFTDHDGFWNSSLYARDNLNKKNTNYLLNMSDDYLNKYIFKQGSFGYTPDMIPVNDFNQSIWVDASRGQTPMESAGFVSNTLNQTSNRVGSGFVTPGQVINTMINAGIGYGTAWLAGKTLGALAGVSPETQKKLQEIGTWGGIIGGIGNAASHY